MKRRNEKDTHVNKHNIYRVVHSAFLTKELDLANHQYVYGILVAIMFEANERHHLPHFHVRYQNFKASIAIEDGRVLAGVCHPSSYRWCRHGLSCTGMICLLIEFWRQMAKSLSASHHYSKRLK